LWVFDVLRREVECKETEGNLCKKRISCGGRSGGEVLKGKKKTQRGENENAEEGRGGWRPKNRGEKRV